MTILRTATLVGWFCGWVSCTCLPQPPCHSGNCRPTPPQRTLRQTCSQIRWQPEYPFQFGILNPYARPLHLAGHKVVLPLQDGAVALYDGSRWVRLPTPDDSRVTAVSGTDLASFLVGKEDGQLWEYRRSSWRKMQTQSTSRVTKICALPKHVVLRNNDNRLILVEKRTGKSSRLGIRELGVQLVIAMACDKGRRIWFLDRKARLATYSPSHGASVRGQIPTTKDGWAPLKANLTMDAHGGAFVADVGTGVVWHQDGLRWRQFEPYLRLSTT